MNREEPDTIREDLTILEKTFLRLQSLYDEQGLKPGSLDRIGLKPGWTTVVGSKGECGTAFRFSGPHKVYEGQNVDAEQLRKLVGRSLMDVVEELIGSSLIPLRAVAVAALSALSQAYLTEDSLVSRGFLVRDDRSVLESVVGPDDVVTLIGYGGMLENLLGKCKELHVADMRSPETLLTTIIGGEIEYAPRGLTLHGPDEDEALLARSDVAIITASTLVNGTIDALLRFATPVRAVGLYGPSASVIPDVLFESGVDFVMSHHVLDTEKFIHAMMTDMNMEAAIRRFQRYQTVVSAVGQ